MLGEIQIQIQELVRTPFSAQSPRPHPDPHPLPWGEELEDQIDKMDSGIPLT